MTHLSFRESTENLMEPEIIRIANEQAHEAAMKYVDAYNGAYERVFNYLFRKLLMPHTDETPAWVVRLANYFSPDAEIDEVFESGGGDQPPDVIDRYIGSLS